MLKNACDVLGNLTFVFKTFCRLIYMTLNVET